jgi:hypothetical protein
MFDKELYKETFSVLKAPDNTLLEVMKMKNKQNKKRVPLKAKLVIAVAVAVVFTTTALAYGDSIVKFMFGDSTATNITFEEYDSRDFTGYEVACGIQIINRASAGEWEVDPSLESCTFEEINALIPFEIGTPTYNPLSGGEFMYRGIPDNDSVVTFYYNGNESINIHQFYAGDDAYIEMENPLEMQTVIFSNGTEALALFYEMENQLNPIDNGEKIQLYWMKGGSFYTMTTTGFVCALDTMIAIAESI